MGQRNATEAMAHFMCEMLVRCRNVGSNSGANHCYIALTQDALATILGVSSVHINRTLQAIRSLHLADHSNFELVVHDFDGLAELGEFDGAYLAPV